MEGFIQAVEAFSAWLWGIPMMGMATKFTEPRCSGISSTSVWP